MATTVELGLVDCLRRDFKTETPRTAGWLALIPEGSISNDSTTVATVHVEFDEPTPTGCNVKIVRGDETMLQVADDALAVTNIITAIDRTDF